MSGQVDIRQFAKGLGDGVGEVVSEVEPALTLGVGRRHVVLLTGESLEAERREVTVPWV